MTALFDALQSPTAARFVSVLLHSLWQGAALALLAGLALRGIPAARGELRYRIALSALLLVAFGCFLTWSFLGPAWSFSAAGVAGHGIAADHSHAAIDHDAVGQSPSTWGTPTSSAIRSSAAKASLVSRITSVAVPVLLCGWLLGAVVMLARMASSLHAARKLLRGTPVSDGPFLELVDRVRRQLGLRRPVRVLAAAGLVTPVICGILTPALIIPAALLSGIAPDQQLAIVAHELAHVRRWDFVINLLQLVIESLLFFNPAVWWLSRQVRVEREACCDALAVSLTRAPLEYAETLASWAERMIAPRPFPSSGSPVLAFAEPADGGSLVDRVRRVLAPAQTPKLRVRWGTLFGLLALVSATLFLVARGTDWAVAQAAKALTDSERVEVVTKAREEVKLEPELQLRNGKRVRIRAQIRTWDGKPVPVYHLSLSSEGPAHGTSGLGTSIAGTGVVDQSIDGGMISAAMMAPGYAPVLFPKRPALGGTEIDYGEVVLPPGHSARVRFADPDGKPVHTEKISFGPEQAMSYPNLNLKTNDAGEATFANVIDVPYKVSARARGFQPVLKWTGKLPEDGLTTITLRPARVTTGRVVDESGAPAAGVEIDAMNERSERGWDTGGTVFSYDHSTSPEPWASTDADGRFRIDQIADGTALRFLLKKDGIPRGLVCDITAGEQDLVWTLDPPVSVRGRVIGDLDLINKDARYRSIFFSILRKTRQQPRDQVMTGNLKIEPDGRFEFQGLVAGLLSIRTPSAKLERELTASIDDLVIPLTPPGSESPARLRSLSLLFSSEGKTVVPGGRVLVRPSADDPQQTEVAIRGPETRVEIPEQGRIRISGAELLGFRFEGPNESYFAAEKLGPTLVLPVVPAGVIRGRVLDHAGQPAAGASIQFGFESSRLSSSLNEVLTNSVGEFLATPVPLPGTAHVIAGIERARVLSEPVAIDAAHPEPNVTLTLPRLVSAEVLVRDDAGKPLGGCPIGLDIALRNAKTSIHHGLSSIRTDADGRGTFTGLGEDLTRYQLVLPRNGPWLAEDFRFAPTGVTEIQLRRGRVLSGRVLDDAGTPVSSVTVAASVPEGERDRSLLPLFEAEEKTDDEGRFRFSNLPDLPVRLQTFGLSLSIDQQETLHRPGAEGIELRGTPAEYVRARQKSARP